MLGDFITRTLILLLGYGYPAFECFKAMEVNRVQIEELRFWCQYWTIVAVLTICERIGDTFISWMPMYGEIKLAFFIYLWYPQFKGTGYVYDKLLRPYITNNESDLERKLQNLRARAWDFAIYYWNNCTDLGQTKFFEMLQFLANQSGNSSITGIEYFPSAPPLPPDASSKQSSKKKKSSGSTNYRAISESPKSNLVQVKLHNQTEYLQEVNPSIPESPTGLNSSGSETYANDNLKHRLWRFRPFQWN
ncbi:putative HVA22-like protein g isoform X2 [Tripterygium wilfordii]|uniref:putative HVA22-like protein g isoform X2 n=1 Tax=Tripterygium wilfordii TaxID=458696 RepID=UPI0018F7F0B5|nr:putative HVA22-like protein g isoform X2 [Tripterygium wilfordii]